MNRHRHFRALLLSCALLWTTPPASPAAGAAGDAYGTVTVGVQIEALRELNLQRHEFTLTGTIWWRHADADFNALRGTRLAGPGELRLAERARARLPDGAHLTEAYFEVRVFQELQTERYPYDRHPLRFTLETGDPKKPARVVADSRASGFAKSPVYPEWVLSDFAISAGASGLAGASMAPSVPTITIAARAERTNRRALFDHFIGFYVAQFLCLLGFLINPALLQQRLTIATPSIFAAVGYKIVNNTVLGTSFSLLSATLSVGSFFMIILYLVVSVSLFKMHENGQAERASKLNDVAAIAFLVVWLAALATLFGHIRGFGLPGSV